MLFRSKSAATLKCLENQNGNNLKIQMNFSNNILGIGKKEITLLLENNTTIQISNKTGPLLLL